MIRNTRKFFGAWDLKRKAKQVSRQKRIHNFKTAASAGILFNCRNDEEFKAVKEFKQFLENESIKTDVIGYVSDKQVPDHYLLRSGFNFFCKKDLTWYFSPNTPYAEEFKSKKFDILFDLSLKNLFPIEYICRLSPSDYKIGRFSESEDHDLMIDINKNNTVSYLIEQIVHYLSVLQTRNGSDHSN